MMDSDCDVYFNKNRCWIAKDDVKELDMIRDDGLVFVEGGPTKSMRDSETLDLNPMTAAEVEQAALTRETAAFGAPGPKAEDTMAGDDDPSVHIKVTTRPATFTSEKRYVSIVVGTDGCVATSASDKRHLRTDPTVTDESGLSRIEFDFAEIGRESE